MPKTSAATASPDRDHPAGLTRADIRQLSDLLHQLGETMFCLSRLVQEPGRWDEWLSGIRGSARTMSLFAQEQSSPALVRLNRLCNR